jgi:hypothetical protein
MRIACSIALCCLLGTSGFGQISEQEPDSGLGSADNQSVATWDQSGLAGFMFAGNAVDAPGGNFHFEEGTAP